MKTQKQIDKAIKKAQKSHNAIYGNTIIKVLQWVSERELEWVDKKQ